MSDEDWEQGFAKSIGIFLNGEAISSTDRFGDRIVDDTFYCIVSASELDLDWMLPPERWGRAWEVWLDTSEPTTVRPSSPGRRVGAGEIISVTSRSLMILRRSDPSHTGN